jgi:hypothetical protein
MYIVLEVDNASMSVTREFPLFTPEGVETFKNKTNIQIKKEWLYEERFTEHLFEQLENSSNEEISYMVIPVTVH